MITLAISVGGNLFQMVVIDPIWSASPPESTRVLFPDTPLYAGVVRFHLNPFYAFGLLCFVAALVLNWNVPGVRNWILAALVLQLVVIVSTFAYFHRINDLVIGRRGEGLDAAMIKTLVRRWVLADRFRFAFRFGTFLCLLRALRLFGSAA